MGKNCGTKPAIFFIFCFEIVKWNARIDIGFYYGNCFRKDLMEFNFEIENRMVYIITGFFL